MVQASGANQMCILVPQKLKTLKVRDDGSVDVCCNKVQARQPYGVAIRVRHGHEYIHNEHIRHVHVYIT
jgi:hypothetical protein